MVSSEEDAFERSDAGCTCRGGVCGLRMGLSPPTHGPRQHPCSAQDGDVAGCPAGTSRGWEPGEGTELGPGPLLVLCSETHLIHHAPACVLQGPNHVLALPARKDEKSKNKGTRKALRTSYTPSHTTKWSCPPPPLPRSWTFNFACLLFVPPRSPPTQGRE